MAFFGLDIGAYAVKLVRAESGGHPKVSHVSMVSNPAGQSLPNDPNHFQQLASAIKDMVRDQGLAGMAGHLSVPGLQAYVSIVEMPAMSDAELASAIKWEAEQHIPVSLDEVNFEYDVVWRPPRGSSETSMSVFLVGVPKTVIERYLELMRAVGVEVIGMEPEVVSLSRKLMMGKKMGTDSTTLICNMGALSTTFIIVDQERIEVAHSTSIGSLSLTRALEKAFGLEPSQAEEYKRTYGLNQSQLEGKVRAALIPIFEAQVSEIKKMIQFYVSKTAGKGGVKRLLLTGGGANLPDMAAYLTQLLSIEVVTDDPFAGADVGKIKSMPSDRASYGVAMGLAVKEF